MFTMQRLWRRGATSTERSESEEQGRPAPPPHLTHDHALGVRLGMLTLKELVRCYLNLVEDSTRVMLRIKALFRARAIPTPGTSVYRVSNRGAWLAKIESRGARMRAASLLWQLDSLPELRPKAKSD